MRLITTTMAALIFSSASYGVEIWHDHYDISQYGAASWTQFPVTTSIKPGPHKVIEHHYDRNGKQTDFIEAEYDTKGLLQRSVSQSRFSSTKNAYQWDRKGLLVTIKSIYKSGSSGNEEETISLFKYDENGCLIGRNVIRGGVQEWDMVWNCEKDYRRSYSRILTGINKPSSDNAVGDISLFDANGRVTVQIKTAMAIPMNSQGTPMSGAAQKQPLTEWKYVALDDGGMEVVSSRGYVKLSQERINKNGDRVSYQACVGNGQCQPETIYEYISNDGRLWTQMNVYSVITNGATKTNELRLEARVVRKIKYWE